MELTPSLTNILSPVAKLLTPSIVSVLFVALNPPSPSASTKVVEDAVDAIVKLSLVTTLTDFFTSNPLATLST